MASTNDGNRRTFKAAADLSSSQYFIVKQDSNGDVVLAAAATDKLLGVLENKPTSGGNASVRLVNSAGTAKVKAGGTIAIGDLITADSAGKAVATTTAADNLLGRAIKGGAANEIVEFIPAGIVKYAVT